MSRQQLRVTGQVADPVEVISEPTTQRGAPAGSTAVQRARALLDLPLVLDMALLAVLLLVLAFLWGRAWNVWYWLDEGISLGIASHPLHKIPALLRQDGSPPVYYLLLHGWMRAFGTSEAQTHSLSLVFALATVPAALWAGWSLFGRRTGWMLAILVAVNPFVASYATETRMYSLVVFVATLGLATFLHGFVFRRRRYILPFTFLLALLLYTHNWGAFFALGTGIGVLLCLALGQDRRRLLLDAALAFGGVAVLYAPWVPTALFQRSHTGAPWAVLPTLKSAQEEIAELIGGTEVVVALGIGAGTALVTLLRRPRQSTALAVLATAVIPVIIVMAGWATSRTNSVWAFRYLAVALVPILLITAVGLARGGQVALAALWVTVFLTLPIAVKGPPYEKGNDRDVAAKTSPLLRAGDLVVSPDFGEIPLLAHYLPAGLDYASSAGLVRDEHVADHREAIRRMREGTPQDTLTPLLDRLRIGSRVLVACPPPRRQSPELTEFLLLLDRRCDEVRSLVLNDRRLHLEVTVEPVQGAQVLRSTVAILLVKQAA